MPCTQKPKVPGWTLATSYMTGFPLVGEGGDWVRSPTLPEKLACPPMPPPNCFDPKMLFCHFHAVFHHFAQIVSPNSQPHLGNTDKVSVKWVEVVERS